MKRLRMATFILLFLALVLVCGQTAAAQADTGSATHGSGACCPILHGAGELTGLPLQPGPHAFSAAIRPGSAVLPSWFLAHSIDHPPELPA
ncbi:MAG: hypothetical protein HY712_00330 [candidate division NC10 bacterium]|nr:hypothetical protein [candidate division NC10 bacterium]